MNLQHSFNITAVDGKYGGPGLVLEYLKSNTCQKKFTYVIIIPKIGTLLSNNKFQFLGIVYNYTKKFNDLLQQQQNARIKMK